MSETDAMVVFRDRKIRRVWFNDEWHYSVTDIIAILTDSKDELAYWRKLKQREPQLVIICHGLKVPARDHKMRYTDCVNTKNAFRLILSIPSKKAEPFKQWLAQVGKERIDEIENPKLTQEWIDKRLQGLNSLRHINRLCRTFYIRNPLADMVVRLPILKEV